MVSVQWVVVSVCWPGAMGLLLAFFLDVACKLVGGRRSIHQTGSGACGSGGQHDGTGACGRAKFLCYNFQKAAMLC